MIPYTPTGGYAGILKIYSCPSAWLGLERYIAEIMKDFNIKNDMALEFGVDRGYSTTVFSNFFKRVIGVDTFESDKHANNNTGNLFEQTKKNLSYFPNIEIIKDNFYNFINQNTSHYNLIHIDIVHDYKPTFECAEWAIQHGDITLLHDTESFPAVKQVCEDISSKYGIKFYNIKEHFGLGILIK